MNRKNMEIVQKAIVNHCVRVLIKSFQELKKTGDFRLDWEEDDFTEKLRTVQKESCWEESLFLETQMNCTRAEDSTPGYAARSPCIDIHFEIQRSEKSFHCYFEAKRIKGNGSSLSRQYVINGVDRFLAKRYPRGHMVAYLVEGNLQDAVAKINRYLCRKKREEESLRSMQSENMPDCFESNHKEYGSMLHIIMDFVSGTLK
ncbi:MAG: hypothetical protein Q4D38_12150 [Planctomycetia bacterium]|nr:hypothetical protein [Planctomycetia bacterium]